LCIKRKFSKKQMLPFDAPVASVFEKIAGTLTPTVF